jgi:ubiquinone/menaquinone biosynthesis C-methylase UbiE
MREEAQMVVAPIVATERTRSAQSFWGRYFSFYDTLNEAIPYREMIAENVDRLGVGQNAWVLDAGTGTGNVAIAMLGRGVRVTGIDFVDSALEVCRRKAPEGDFQFGDLSKPLSFPSRQFDGVVCCCVLHLIDDDARALAVREFARVAKPGARVVVTVFGAGFRAMKVYGETLRKHRQASGILSSVAFGLRYLIATTRILYYVAQIRRRERAGVHKFLSRDGLHALLEGAGLEVKSVEPIFAGQCWIGVAAKPAP